MNDVTNHRGNDTGLERPAFSLEKPGFASDPTHNPKQRQLLPNNPAPQDPRLQAIIDRWNSLTEVTKSKIARLAKWQSQ